MTKENLKSIFVKEALRENSGTETSRRYDYQECAAIYYLIEYHEAGLDYRIVLDYHDDFTVLVPSDEPTQAHFYQVKTKKNNYWTFGKLLSKSKDGLSIISKLYDNYRKFPNHTGGLYLLSNTEVFYQFKLKKASNGKEPKNLSRKDLLIAELNDGELNKLWQHLNEQLGLEIDSETTPPVTFVILDMPLANHHEAILGKFQSFLSRYLEKEDLPGQTLLKVLKDQIHRRQCHCEQIEHFGDIDKKSIDRKQFEAMLKNAVFKSRIKDYWERIDRELKTENVPWLNRRKLKSQCEAYIIKLFDPLDSLLHDARHKIIDFIGSEDNLKDSYYETVKHVKKSLDHDLEKIIETNNDIFAESMILLELLINEEE